MAARAIIGTAPRKFPLGGTASYSNWTFQLSSARVRWALGQASILDGRLHVCAKGRGRWVKTAAPLLQSPTDTAAAALPEGPTQSTRSGLQLLNGTSQGRPGGMAARSWTSPSEAALTV